MMKKLLAIILLLLLTACSVERYDGYAEYHIQLSPVVIDIREITIAATEAPTAIPTITPLPTLTPLPTPTLIPTIVPTIAPTQVPTIVPTVTDAIYVSLMGNNANSGTLDAPYRTIQYAVGKAKAGTTIYVREGTYSEYIVLSVNGLPGAPITLTSYSGEQVTIDGGSSIAIRSASGLNNWVIEGLTIKSTNRYTTRMGWWGETMTHDIIVRNNMIFGANLTLGYSNTYEGNEVSGVGYTANSGDAGLMEISTSHHNTFKGNNIHDFTAYNSRGIWSQGLTHDSLFEGNTVSNIWSSSGGLGQCINLDGAGNVEWRHTVRDNTVSQCSYVGIQLENNFETLVEGNTINSEGSAGIIVISYDSKVGCKVGGEEGQYGNATSCKGLMTNNRILTNHVETQDFWGWGYGGLVDWDTAGMIIRDNTFIAGSWNTAYPAINIEDNSYNHDVVVLDNTIITR